MQATAILLNFARPGNLPAILDSLEALPFIDEIIIWDNAETVSNEASGLADRAMVAGSDRNLFTYGRFAAAAHLASNELIYTQDDDYLIRNIPAIYERALTAGPDRIVAGLDEGHLRFDPKMYFHGRHEVLLGWGSFFRRSAIVPAFRPYLDRWGEDEVLHRKADRLFGMLLGGEHITMLSEAERLEGVAGPMALYRRRDHGLLSRLARERIGELFPIQREGDDDVDGREDA